MGCLLFSASFSHASNTRVTKNDGTPIVVIEKTCHSSSEKGNSIIPTIDGHVLTVVFTENLGQVAVDGYNNGLYPNASTDYFGQANAYWLAVYGVGIRQPRFYDFIYKIPRKW